MDLQKYLEMVYHIDNNTSATLIITIIVFAVGQFFIFLARSFEKEQKRKVTRILFRQGLKNMSKGARKQAHLFKKSCNSLSTISMRFPTMTTVSMGILNIQKDLGTLDSSEAFLFGFRRWRFPKNKKLQLHVLSKI